jgi:hypothetical protein
MTESFTTNGGCCTFYSGAIGKKISKDLQTLITSKGFANIRFEEESENKELEKELEGLIFGYLESKYNQ